MRLSLIPWEWIWVLSLVVLIFTVIWWLVKMVRQRAFLWPKSWLMALSLVLVIAIPLGTKALNYRFNLQTSESTVTQPDHPIADLQTRIYDQYTPQELHEASIRAVQASSTYLQPWTIMFTDLDEYNQAARLVAQVPVIFTVDDFAVTIEPVLQPVEPISKWRVDVYSGPHEPRPDLGENARHIKQFYQALEAELAELP